MVQDFENPSYRPNKMKKDFNDLQSFDLCLMTCPFRAAKGSKTGSTWCAVEEGGPFSWSFRPLLNKYVPKNGPKVAIGKMLEQYLSPNNLKLDITFTR